MITKDKWVWMPHPGHLCVARDCRFHLNTRIGKYLISTVGEYEPDMAIREIEAASKKITLVGMGDARRADAMKKLGFEEIGLDRTYETMVFEAVRAGENDEKWNCCLWRQSGSELDFEGYNDATSAYQGHLKMCQKWAKKK